MVSCPHDHDPPSDASIVHSHCPVPPQGSIMSCHLDRDPPDIMKYCILVSHCVWGMWTFAVFSFSSWGFCSAASLLHVSTLPVCRITCQSYHNPSPPPHALCHTPIYLSLWLSLHLDTLNWLVRTKGGTSTHILVLEMKYWFKLKNQSYRASIWWLHNCSWSL